MSRRSSSSSLADHPDARIIPGIPENVADSNDLGNGLVSSFLSYDENSDNKAIIQKRFDDSRRILAEPQPLLEFQVRIKNKDFLISLKNLERWKLDRANNMTLDFELEDNLTKEVYTKLQQDMHNYYLPMLEHKIGILVAADLKPRTFAVVHLGNGRFERAILVEKDTSVPNNFKFILNLKDKNTACFFESAKMTLFYMVEQFSEVPYKTQQLFLDGTEFFHHMVEFRNALCDTVTESDILNTTISVVKIDHGIVHAILKHPGWESTINDVVIKKTCYAFPAPSFPKAGESSSGVAHVSHCEKNGIIFIQFGSHILDCFNFHQEQFTSEAVEKMKPKAMSPRPLNAKKLYLAEFAGLYCRCRVLSVKNGMACVYFVDYGNIESVEVENIIPCQLVHKYFDRFPPMAIAANVVNVESFDTEVFLKRLDIEKIVAVVTVSDPTPKDLAQIDLLILGAAKTTTFSELAIRENWAKPWTKPVIPTRDLHFITPEVLQSVEIDMRATNWSSHGAEEIHAEPNSILDAVVVAVYSPAKIIIRPLNALNELQEMEESLKEHPVYNYTPLNPETLVQIPDPETSEWRKGDFCAVKPGDSFDQFRIQKPEIVRGRVLDEVNGPTSCVRVLLLDYMKVVEMKPADLLFLPPEFCMTPPLAAVLQLTGKKPESWGYHQEQALHCRLFEKRFLVKVDKVRINTLRGSLDILGDLYLVPGVTMNKDSCHSVSAANNPESADPLGTKVIWTEIVEEYLRPAVVPVELTFRETLGLDQRPY